MFTLKSFLGTAALAALASAKTITITATSDKKFDPDTVDAAKGDIIEFHFQPNNHSVVAGSYDFPCSPAQFGNNGSFFSGFQPASKGEADKVFRVTLNDTEPIPFYSSQGNECAEGWVGIINPTDDMNLTTYKDNASELSRAVTPGRSAYGGQLVDNDDDSDDNDDDKNDDDKNDDDKSGDDSSSDDSDSDSSSDNGDDGDAAAGIRVPVVGLLIAVGAGFFLA